MSNMTAEPANPLDARMARLEGSYEQIDKRLTNLEGDLNRLEDKLEARFDRLDRKIDARFNLISLIGGLLVVLQLLTTFGILRPPS